MNTYNELIKSWKLDRDSLDLDGEYVSKLDFNAINHEKLELRIAKYKIDFSKVPQPFWGNIINPSVIFLYANPSIKDNGQEYKDKLLENIKGESFDFLDKNEFDRNIWEDNEDAMYWIKRFRDIDSDLEGISYNKYFGEFEIHGYNSTSYKELLKSEVKGKYLPTQNAQIAHIRYLLSQDNPPLIVIVRKKTEWLKAIPELKDKYITVRSSQSAYLTRRKNKKGNINLEDYNKIIERVKTDHNSK